MNEIASKWRYAIASSGRKTKFLPKAPITFTVKNYLDSCLVCEDDLKVELSFAGTQGTIPDWAENAEAHANMDGIHHGYADAIDSFISPDFIDYIKGAIAFGKDVEGSGHSQGIQICVLAYYLFKRYGIKMRRIVHFGCPPWGLKRACDILDSFCTTTRVFTPHDPVPMRRLGMHREGSGLEINGARIARVPVLCAFDHDYPVYTRGIRDYSASIGDIEGVKAMNLLL